MTYEEMLKWSGITEEYILPDDTLVLCHSTLGMLVRQPNLVSCLSTYRSIARLNPKYKCRFWVDYKPSMMLLQLATKFGIEIREVKSEGLIPVVLIDNGPSQLEYAIKLWETEDARQS